MYKKKPLVRAKSETTWFLVPYVSKTSFTKVQENRYVILVISTETVGPHPVAKLIQNLGPVSSLQAYAEYEMYRKGIKHPPDPISVPCDWKPSTAAEEVCRRHGTIMTIDSENTMDADDAFSLDIDLITGKPVLYVYITLEPLKIASKIRQMATIYMPTEKRTMFPPSASLGLLGLLVGEPREVLSYRWDTQTFRREVIRVNRRLTYQEALSVKEVGDAAALLDCKREDLVPTMMKQFNLSAALLLQKHQLGFGYVLRDTIHESSELLGTYYMFRETTPIHPPYAHCTSPIRRAADLINLRELLRIIEEQEVQDEVQEVVTTTISLSQLNTQTKRIKRLQTNLRLLDLFAKGLLSTTELYNGTIIEQDNTKVWVYLPVFKVLIPCVTSSLPEEVKVLPETSLLPETSVKVRLYYFAKENTYRRKIRGIVVE
jgi:exoribonuclease R